MSSPGGELKVVLVPFLALGHLIPHNIFAQALAKSGVHVYYFSTPKNIERLPKLPSKLAPLITYVPVPFPKVPGSPLPEGAEATIDVPVHHTRHLFHAFDLLKEPLKQFVADNKPDWIIIDYLAYWAADVAKEAGVPLACFSTFNASCNAFFGPPDYLAGEGRKKLRSSPEDLTSPPHWVKNAIPASTLAYRHFEAVPTLLFFYGDISPEVISPAGRIAKSLQETDLVAIRTCSELESDYLKLFAGIIGKHVIPAGLLPPPLPGKRQLPDKSWEKIFGWLDQHQPNSVMYVSFGSECKLTKTDIHAIADGIEKSEVPFLWALRKPDWATEDADFLPAGFLERTAGKGKLFVGWAPQFEVMAHPAIGGFLFHTGWSSCIEGLQNGKSLVCLPMVAEQGLNAKFLVDKGLASEVDRNGEDGSFTGEDVAKCLKQAMTLDSEGLERRREVAAVVSDGALQDRYIDGLVKHLYENRVSQKE